VAPSRLALAFALSAVLHGFLIYSPGFAPAPSDRPAPGYLNARLNALPDPVPAPAAPAAPSVVAAAPALPVVAPASMPVDAGQMPDAPGLSEITPGVPQGGSAAEPPPGAVEPAAETAAEPADEPAAAEADTSRLIEFTDPVHYPAKDLDVYPRRLGQAEPVYPDAALAARIAGNVTLAVLIDERGRVTEVTVVEAQPEGLFEASAVSMVSASTFTPAMKDGRAVRSRLLFAVEFDPDRRASP
jgi:protein TonB